MATIEVGDPFIGPDLADNIRQYREGCHKRTALEPQIESRWVAIDDELASIREELAELRNRPDQLNVEHRITDLERRESILTDEDQMLRAFDGHLDHDNKTFRNRAFNQFIDLSLRTGTAPSTSRQYELNEELEAFTKLQDEDRSEQGTVATSTDSRIDFGASTIVSAVKRCRNEVVNARKDNTGRVAEYRLQRMSQWVWNDGRNIPPRVVVDNMGLIRASESVRKLANAEKSYKLWKRRAARQGIKIHRQLEDDSEFSWNIEESGDSSIVSHPKEHKAHVRDGRRRGRRHCDNLPIKVGNPFLERTPPDSARQLSLTSASINSGFSASGQYPSKRSKRMAQWQAIQNRRLIATLEVQSRCRLPRRKRPFSRSLNNWISHQPRFFRWSDERELERVRRSRDADSLASSDEGDFEDWDKPRHAD